MHPLLDTTRAGVSPDGRSTSPGAKPTPAARYRYLYALLEVAPMSKLTTVPRGNVPQ